jgi:hypothetical protein
MNNQACPAYTDHLAGKARGVRQQIKAMIRPVMLAGALIGGWGTEAVAITWNTCADGGDSNTTCQPGNLTPSPFTGTVGGTGALTFSGIEDATNVVVVRAFKTGTLGTGDVSARIINIFEGGLGAGNESSPQHAIDNVGFDELLVFQFAHDGYIPQSFRIGYKHTDADIVTYIGGTLADDIFGQFDGTFPWDANGGDLGSLGFRREVFPQNPDSDSVAVGVDILFNSVNNDPLGLASGRYLVVTARNEASGSTDGGEDKFKFQQLAATLPDRQVPQPSTIALLVVSVVAVGAWARRRSA